MLSGSAPCQAICAKPGSSFGSFVTLAAAVLTPVDRSDPAACPPRILCHYQHEPRGTLC